MFLLLWSLFPALGTSGGAQRWLHFGGVNFQPGELAKFAVIFFVAPQLDRRGIVCTRWRPGCSRHSYFRCRRLLLLLQPDFGTTVMITV